MVIRWVAAALAFVVVAFLGIGVFGNFSESAAADSWALTAAIGLAFAFVAYAAVEYATQHVVDRVSSRRPNRFRPRRSRTADHPSARQRRARRSEPGAKDSRMSGICRAGVDWGRQPIAFPSERGWLALPPTMRSGVC